ncbi:hypothetical protein QUF80_20365 [Desulfococcaceae bacterium HSG8]|nr:hypothetical protein [Desulfococcaceae bacterium HSG8]
MKQRVTKRYLTGIDWLIHTLDHMTRRATGAGNSSQIVMELNGIISENRLHDLLTRFIRKIPVVSGYTVRDYNLAPYWKTSLSESPRFPFNVRVMKDEDDVFPFLEKGINTPFENHREHLAFHVAYTGKRTFLAMTFDHCLFDARGAEAFLAMIHREWGGHEHRLEEISPPNPAHLDRWMDKFRSGQQVNRAFLKMAKNAPPRVLPSGSASHNRRFRFKIISFDEDETSRIIETAYEEAGYLMLMPYLLAVTTSVLHDIFTARQICSGDYIIPVNIDMRPSEKLEQEVFFNHVSFLMFRVQPPEADCFPLLLKSVKAQMYEQVKSGLSGHIREVSFLTRIAPLPILSHLIRMHFKGETGSFSFSYVGEAGYPFHRFMEKEIAGFFHMPRVPTPPGIGIFFHRFRGKLSATFSYLEDILTHDEADGIVETLRARFNG